MDSVKVIFLDIDGVLNSDTTTRRTRGGFTFVGERQLRRLRHIVDAAGAEVVLSSDWRYNRDTPGRNGHYLELRDELLRYGIRFYGFTPELPSGHRGAEIAQWLAEHPEVSDFVILDDRTDIEPNKDRWVQTVMSRGLGAEEADKAIRILMGSSAADGGRSS